MEHSPYDGVIHPGFGSRCSVVTLGATDQEQFHIMTLKCQLKQRNVKNPAAALRASQIFSGQLLTSHVYRSLHSMFVITYRTTGARIPLAPVTVLYVVCYGSTGQAKPCVGTPSRLIADLSAADKELPSTKLLEPALEVLEGLHPGSLD